MSGGFYGQGKRQREANKSQKKKVKMEKRRQRRESGPADVGVQEREALPEVKLEDILISGVAPRPQRSSRGPGKLFVGGLGRHTSDTELREAFSKFGPLLEAIVMTDRMTGESRGFGFVTFERSEDAHVALKELNGTEVDGGRLRIDHAR
jgi:RNA recognition motif-containing protein